MAAHGELRKQVDVACTAMHGGCGDMWRQMMCMSHVVGIKEGEGRVEMGF